MVRPQDMSIPSMTTEINDILLSEETVDDWGLVNKIASVLYSSWEEEPELNIDWRKFLSLVGNNSAVEDFINREGSWVAMIENVKVETISQFGKDGS